MATPKDRHGSLKSFEIKAHWHLSFPRHDACPHFFIPGFQMHAQRIYPGFMQNSQTGGKTWGIPFQRSTIVMYWNKDLFKQAGLNPDKAPATWAEMTEYAKKLTKTDAGGNVSQWGVKIPSTGFPYWLFQGLTTPNDALLMNEAGTETYFDKPAVIEALQYWVDLSAKHKVMPGGAIEWGTTPKDFLEKKGDISW